jgi:trans-2,3-dihydro-3-hydroxyanthranilate isomerase
VRLVVAFEQLRREGVVVRAIAVRTLRYVHVDVFTTQPLEGNPLAVFPAAGGLDDATMQRIARELNLSETTFVFPPADPAHTARVRIFTPQSELAFAGHPTLGTAYVLRTERGGEAFTLEENVGPVAVRVEQLGDETRFWLTTPPIAFGARLDPGAVARALGLDAADLLPGAPPEVAGAGSPMAFVAVRDRGAVDRAVYDARVLRAAEPDVPSTGTFLFTPDAPAATGVDGVYARMFAPENGITEDPATGSATGPLAAYMIRHGLLSGAGGTRLLSEQGTKMGRRSLLHVLVHVDAAGATRIEVGGAVAPLARGELTLPG